MGHTAVSDIEQLKPLGPVTVPSYGPLRFSPCTSVTRSARGGGGGGTAAIAAVTVCPAIVADNVWAAPALAAAFTVTVPLPEPDVGDTLSPALVLLAVHADGEQPSGAAVTATACDPPPNPNDNAVGDVVN